MASGPLLGGCGGNAIRYAQLTIDVAADTLIEDAADLEILNDDGSFGFVYELDEFGEETETVQRVAVRNISLYSEVQGSLASTPIRIWGELVTLVKIVEEVEVTYDCLIMLGPYVEVIAMSGAVVSPANGVGQVPMHKTGVKASVADGGPCGAT